MPECMDLDALFLKSEKLAKKITCDDFSGNLINHEITEVDRVKNLVKMLKTLTYSCNKWKEDNENHDLRGADKKSAI